MVEITYIKQFCYEVFLYGKKEPYSSDFIEVAQNLKRILIYFSKFYLTNEKRYLNAFFAAAEEVNGKI